MIGRDLLEAWKLWRKTKSSKKKEVSFKKEATGKVYKKTYIAGYSEGDFKFCLGKVRNRFIKKYDARKQTAYMGAGLIKLKSLYVDAMSSKLKILNCYLTSFPSPNNK